jgi:serpin B
MRMDKRIKQLVVAFLEGDLDEAGAQRLVGHLETHAEDREEFLALAAQARAMEALFAPANDLAASVISELRARENGGRFVSGVVARLPRRFHRRWRPIALAAAASILLAVGAAIWLAGPDKTPQKPDGPIAVTTPHVATPVQVASLGPGWRAEGRAAEYEIVEPGLVRLERGELFVESVPVEGGEAPRETLKIETSAGVATATGTKFYIGSHAEAPQKKGATMTRMTRILVVAGMVTLANPMGTVTGGANDLLAAEADAAPVKHAVQANSDFAFDMYQQLSKENAGENLFFSPYSISSALAMTAEGARGETAVEMGKVLRFPDAARRVGADAQSIPWRTSLIHTGMGELNDRLTGGKDKMALEAIRAEIAELREAHQAAKAKVAQLRKERKYKEYRSAADAEKKAAAALNKVASQVDQYELRVANALWGEKTYPFLDTFTDTISKHYKTGGVFPSDFKNSFPVERKRINQWVEEQTNNRIKDIIPDIPPQEARLIRLILTNAIYFKGEWSAPFKEANTKPREFTLAGGGKVQTPIMNAQNLEVGRYGAFSADGSLFATPVKIRRGQKAKLYPDESGFALLELPYKGDDLSMVLIAPNDPSGLAAIEKKLDADKLAGWVGKLAKRKVHVFLPKFKMETDYKLHESLPSMGMVRAFADPRDLVNGADFTGMCASDDPRLRLYITKVLHKAFVEVNEKGTEAAAATAVIMGVKRSMPISVPFTPTFKADRPFLFLIRDIKTGSVLFIGRMMKPQK